MGLKQTLRGFARMAPLEQSLKRIQVVLKSHDGRRLTGTNKKRSAINLYKTFCDYAGDKLQGTLKDYVFDCHVGDEVVTPELVDKMTNKFQMLNSCAFRFDYSGLGSIVDIARNAAVKTIFREEHTAQPFRFMDLPNELKEMILKEVLVNRWDPLRTDRHITLPRTPTYRPYSLHWGESCCSNCSARFARGCSCVSIGCYSTSCTCFTSPVPIFLTSKSMYNMASYIFFTQNTFSFPCYHSQRTHDVLSKVPRTNRRLIRHIILESGSFWYTFRSYTARSDPVNFILKYFDLTHLTVDIESKYPYEGRHPYAEEILKTIDQIKNVMGAVKKSLSLK